MSGTASVPNSFAAAVTATGMQIDTNFNTVVAYINNPTNRNNYAASSGATNTLAITFAPPVVGGYTAGLELTWKWDITNTGAVVLNANGIGNANLVNPDGSNFTAGQGLAGSIGKAVYDGTRFISIAQPAQNPGAAKAWAKFQGQTTGTITPESSFNVSQIVRTGTGSYSITFATPFANANYALSGSTEKSGVVGFDGAVVSNTATAFITTYQSQTGSVADATRVSFICFGFQ